MHKNNLFITENIVEALKNHFTDTNELEQALTNIVSQNTFTLNALTQLMTQVHTENERKNFKNQQINVTTSKHELHIYKLTTQHKSYQIVFIRSSEYLIVPVLYDNYFERILDQLTIDSQNVIDYSKGEAKVIKNLQYLGIEKPKH